MSNVTKPVMLDDTGKSVAQALGNVATAINNMDKVQWGQVKGTLSNQTDLKNNLNSLQSQIDSFTALTDGSTTGDAELTNIRVDSAGHTYSTAGDAVRAIDAQVRAIKTGFDGVEYDSPAAQVIGSDAKILSYMGDTNKSEESINDASYASGVSGSVDLSAFYTNVGKQINKNGSISDNANGIVTDFIPVESGDQFEIMLADDLNYCWSVAYYDINKRFVSGVNIPETSYTQTTDTFTVPSDVKYMRVQSLQQSYYGLFKIGSEAVASVVNKLFEAIGDVTDGTKDLADDVISGGTRGKWLENNGAISGTESSTSPYFVSDYIPVVEGEIYNYSLVQLYGNAIYALYSPLKKARTIQQGTSGEVQTGSITIPKGIAYIRVCSMQFPTVFSFTKKFISPTIIETCKEIESHVEKTPYDILDYYDEISTTWSNGYLNVNGTVDATNDYGTTDFISLDDYKQFNVFISYGWNAKGYALYNSAKGVLYTKGSSGGIEEKLVISTDDILTDYPTAKYIRFTTPGNRKHAYGNRKCNNINAVANLILNTGNILYGKKIAFCGDSFTEANNLGSENYDNFYRCYKGFPYWIASRNNMNLYNDGKSGSTMHVVDPENPSTNRPFAYQRYQNVPTDCDYIILQFGLNESTLADDPATLGTKESTDTSTMWGSWNTVLHYLIENIPLAKIGVIMPDAWMTQSYYEALKEICEWWGVPLLDLGGDPNISLMNGGRRQGSGLVLNPVAAQIRNEAFYNDYSQGDAHPNIDGHKWRSTVIEHWIRGL